MAIFTAGYVFSEHDTVTPAKLNLLVDGATVNGLSYTNFNGNQTGVLVYGNTAPTIQRGFLWYDTNSGSEGLKYAFMSPSAGSISKWVYVTPVKQVVCWTDTAVSAGFPMYVGRGLGFFQGSLGNELAVYDGLQMPKIWYNSGATDISPFMVVPAEAAGASSAVLCNEFGFVNVASLGNSPIVAGNLLFTNGSPGRFRDDTIGAQSHVWGIQQLSTGASVSLVPTIFFGVCAYEDYT